MIYSPADKTLIWDKATQDDAESQARRSLYVEVFESMQNIVLQREKFLFSASELTCLARLKTLSYSARYLLIRLCLCKRGKWHTLASLEGRYMSEIGDAARITGVIDELCGFVRDAEPVADPEAREVVDLTLDEDEEDMLKEDVVCPQATPGPAEDDPEFSAFAVDDASASVPDLLACLSVDELKSIAKQMKVSASTPNRSSLIDAILSNASSQSTLNFHVLASWNKNSLKSTAGHAPQLTLNYARDGKKETQYASVRLLVSKMIGRCVRIEPAVFTLFDRLNLVFFRSTTHNAALLLPALLAAFRKRQYGSVQSEFARTADIFPSRDALLAYEEALMLEARIDEAFVNGGASQARQAQAKRKGKGKVNAEDTSSAESSRVQGARVVREIWEKVFARWSDLVASKNEEPVAKAGGVERFQCGYVMTRLVYKGVQALAILKEYELEMKVLRALLAQTKWRRGRRGAWYDRLALVLMTHCERTQQNLEAAMVVVINGLEDEHTHLTYRPRLERRLTRLESLLKIPKDQRHRCDGELHKANEVSFEGVRIYKQHSSASVVPDKSLRLGYTTMSPAIDPSGSDTPRAAAGTVLRQPLERQSEPQKGKTLWVGRHGEEVSVEQLALEYYEDMGFKGIVSTIFGLLFWDVIFAHVPGAFETPFQSAPLDIYDDGFYPARAELIERRLKELEDGRAREIIQHVDKRERPPKTWCIGVDWKYEWQDLLEIADCLGGHALSVICRMVCEDYAQWGGGVPDLLVWNAEHRACKFVEVKSPNDTLQENQKVWIDVLLSSGTSVDLCHVTERGEEEKPKKSRAGRKKKAVVASQPEEPEEPESEEEDFDMLDPSREAGKRSPVSDEFISSTKKRKVEIALRKWSGS